MSTGILETPQLVFRAGPYVPPLIPIGTRVRDEYYGDVICTGVTDARIPWPGFNRNRGLHAGLMPIFFHGLVRATVEEDEAMVAAPGRDSLPGQSVAEQVGRQSGLQCRFHRLGDDAAHT